MDTSDLAKRMKDYESVPKTKLMRRTPVAIRIEKSMAIIQQFIEQEGK